MADRTRPELPDRPRLRRRLALPRAVGVFAGGVLAHRLRQQRRSLSQRPAVEGEDAAFRHGSHSGRQLRAADVGQHGISHRRGGQRNRFDRAEPGPHIGRRARRSRRAGQRHRIQIHRATLHQRGHGAEKEDPRKRPDGDEHAGHRHLRFQKTGNAGETGEGAGPGSPGFLARIAQEHSVQELPRGRPRRPHLLRADFAAAPDGRNRRNHGQRAGFGLHRTEGAAL